MNRDEATYAKEIEDRLNEFNAAIFPTTWTKRFRLQAPWNKAAQLREFIRSYGFQDCSLKSEGFFVYKVIDEETKLAKDLLSVLVLQTIRKRARSKWGFA